MRLQQPPLRAPLLVSGGLCSQSVQTVRHCAEGPVQDIDHVLFVLGVHPEKVEVRVETVSVTA